MKKNYWVFLFFTYLILITILSLLPSSGFSDLKLFPYADKVVHLCMYAGFTFLMMRAWPSFFRGDRQLIPLFVVLFYGLGMEILQDMGHAGRSFELTDVAANTLGYLPGWLAYRLFS